MPAAAQTSEPEIAPVLTIGYGAERTPEEFLSLLARHAVRYLVDVRSRPYSKFRPQFSREAIERSARDAGVAYVFLGDALGGMPADPGCYTGGRVDYDKVRSRDWFQRGLERLETGWRAGHRLAIMCAELEPERCHRSKLIGEALAARGVPVGHIDESGRVITQAAALERLAGGQGALFDTGLTSRRKFRAAADAGEVS